MKIILLIFNSTLNSLCQYSFSFIKANSQFDLFAEIFSRLSSELIAFFHFSNHSSDAKYWKLGDFLSSSFRPFVLVESGCMLMKKPHHAHPFLLSCLNTGKAFNIWVKYAGLQCRLCAVHGLCIPASALMCMCVRRKQSDCYRGSFFSHHMMKRTEGTRWKTMITAHRSNKIILSGNCCRKWWGYYLLNSWVVIAIVSEKF